MISVRDSRTGRKNKYTKLIEEIWESAKNDEFVWYSVETDQIIVGTRGEIMQAYMYDTIFYGQITYEFLGDL